MRKGAEYRDSLRNGWRVDGLDAGRVEDVTTRPANRAMVGGISRLVRPTLRSGLARCDTVLAPIAAQRSVSPIGSPSTPAAG
jgi:hypothetical protein